MKVYARTDIGNMRPVNEDSFYLPQRGENFCAVADGMGGHNAGEVASAIAVEVFARQMRSHASATEDVMRQAVLYANNAIYEESLRSSEHRGMGTTLTALYETDGMVRFAHVGDSRAYLIRGGAIARLTTDHTLVEEMVLKGVITPQEARVHPRRNYVTRALGTVQTVEVDTFSMETDPGDLFLLCSDGLSGILEDSDLLRLALQDKDFDRRLEDMVHLALKRGGSDNITVLLAQCGEADQ